MTMCLIDDCPTSAQREAASANADSWQVFSLPFVRLVHTNLALAVGTKLCTGQARLLLGA